MKKMVVMMIVMALLIGLTACSSGTANKLPKAEAVLTAKIIKFYESSMLVVGENANDLFMVPVETSIYDSKNDLVDRKSLIEGQAIELGYSGTVMESFPMQLAGLAYIKVVEEGDNLVGLYAKVIGDLWETDQGLNSGVEIMALDLSQTTNLSESEKVALAYIVGNTYELQGMLATYNTLVENGHVDPDSLNFEKGLLFKLEVKDTSDDKFTFDASKWRGGDGAYFFIDCIAKKSGVSWTYKVGSEAIS